MKTKILIFCVTAPALAVVQAGNVVNIRAVIDLLFWLFIADLASGLAASYTDWKKGDRKDRWFFGKGEGFNSDKAKKCFYKAALYCGFPLIAMKFQKAFFLKNLKWESVTDAEIDFATCVLLAFCFIELFSIFNENLPKCGINIWHIIKKMIGFYREAKSDIVK